MVPSASSHHRFILASEDGSEEESWREGHADDKHMNAYVLALPFVVIGMIVASAPIILGMKADEQTLATDVESDADAPVTAEELASAA